MASRRNSRNQPYSNRHLDLNNPDNWTSQQLRIKLQQLGIVVPKNIAKSVLKQFYLENKDRQIGNAIIAQTEEVSDPERAVPNPLASASAPDSSANVIDELRNPTADESSSRSNEATGSAHFDSVGGNNMAAIMQSFSIVSQSVAQCASGLQQTVSLIANQKCSEISTSKKFDLAQWYHNRNAEDAPLIGNGAIQSRLTPPSLGYSSITPGTTGVRSDSYSNVDIVAPSVQRNIIEGKDVNLGTLLIPNFEAPLTHSIIADGLHVNMANKPDPRLNRHLSIQEFIQAFGKFKRIMCNAYPERREELDAYEADIINIHNFHGLKFYDYHKIFSAKAAALLREKRVKVDWSLRDRDILSLITAGSSVNVCKICNLIDHATQYCPLQSSVQVENPSSRSSSSSNLQSVDKQGRSRVFHEGREMCNNFNNPKGCYRKVCYLLHQCTKCRATGHGAATCRKSNVPVHSSTSSMSSKNKPEKQNSG